MPNQGALFNSDLYIPFPEELRQLGLPSFLTAQDMRDLAAGMTRHQIEPALMVGGHGGISPIEEFYQILATVD